MELILDILKSSLERNFGGGEFEKKKKEYF